MMRSDERVAEEARLRADVLAGDRAAWRTLYDRAYPALWAYLVWRCAGLRDVAEDMTQETWLVAVRRIRDFDPHRARFIAWLRGIAAHLLRNHFRSRRSEQSLTGIETARDAEGPREEAELIARALAELPERYEMALRAKYLDLWTVEQIAADWDETPKAIESLLTRAREAFRAAYEKHAGNDTFVREGKP
jgi:RNA polymerase sigma-70 factor (ECF subfamily)